MNPASIPSQEGYASFKHPSLPLDTKCQTWYKVLGDLSANRRPLVILHGGPGGSHKSMEDTFTLYATKCDTPIIFYDQIGNGNSTHLQQKRGDETFWTPNLFVAELDNLLQYLGVRDNFDLYGHSWGAKLAAKYAASAASKGSGLHKVIIGSGSCNQRDLQKAVQILIKDLPSSAQENIQKFSEEKKFDAPEYQASLMMFFKKHLCRLDPWPATFLETLKTIREDDTVYVTMLGPDGLNPTGNLRGEIGLDLLLLPSLFHSNRNPYFDHAHRCMKLTLLEFDMTEECKNISQPCLLINGEFDATLDFCLQPWFDGIPKVKWITISNASHLFFLEQPERFTDIVWQFLKDQV